ncbi:DUF4177 domain-containing protein [Nereida sp. MMG025]|uniref:DUF4177 domain-containing protein n=1 Tax=Nereida sp. MMG025 TaxID=2909981 RepID=UPI001F460E13|nr:DUF4177 domain-containing protein [Nereida sp. MMG025]MCF6445250.1 DUF4177 domain-containing protein [Nereida sp. MMG025]
MTSFEYKVVPAPTRGKRAKGAKGPSGRFANALETIMNQMGADGWEYLRTDTLPSEERSGLTSRVTVFQNMLVFRRSREEAMSQDAPVPPKLLERPKHGDVDDKAPAPAPISPAVSADAARQASLTQLPIWNEDDMALDTPQINSVLRLRAKQVNGSADNTDIAAE